MNKKLIAPICTIAAALCLGVGSTWALFTDKSGADVEIAAGQVKLSVSATANFARSRYEDLPPFDAIANAQALSSTHTAVYENGNTADLIASETGKLVTLELDRLTPMDDIEIGLKITNSSNVNIKYRYVVELAGDLLPALEAKLGNDVLDTSDVPSVIYGSWSEVVEPSEVELLNTNLYVAFPNHDGMPGYPEGFDNLFMGKSGSIKISLEAVQGNAKTEDPHDTGYGFYDSYLVDEGLESEHWVHEISNVSEFRNIVTNEGNIKSPTENYPGYGSAKTVYLVINDIDFEQNAIWTDDDGIDDFVFNGSLEGIDSSVTLTGYHLNSGINIDNNMGLFVRGKEFTFKNLILDDFVFDYDAGVNCGFFVSNTGTDNYNADFSFHFENILIKDTCSITAKKSIGSLMGLARGCFDFEAINVVNNADIMGDSSNIAGFVAQASAASVEKGAIGSWLFENCINNGDVIHVGGGYSAGYVNQLQGNIVLTIKNCEQNGNLYNTSNKVAYFINSSSTTVKSINFEGTNRLTSVMYTKDGSKAATVNMAEPTALTAQFDDKFTSDSVNNYGNDNEVMVYAELTLTFDEDHHLQVAGADTVDFSYSVFSISISGRMTIDMTTNVNTGEGSKVLYVERRNNADYSDMKEIMHLGYCAPDADTPIPTGKPTHYKMDKYFIDYSNMESIGFGTRYDAENGLAVIDNTGRTRTYEAIQNKSKTTYSVKLYLEDGTFVGKGQYDTASSEIAPFEF